MTQSFIAYPFLPTQIFLGIIFMTIATIALDATSASTRTACLSDAAEQKLAEAEERVRKARAELESAESHLAIVRKGVRGGQFILYTRDAFSISEPTSYWPGWTTIKTIRTEPDVFEAWLKEKGIRSRKWNDPRDPTRRCVQFKTDEQRVEFMLRWM
jgi:hypothetical protein